MLLVPLSLGPVPVRLLLQAPRKCFLMRSTNVSLLLNQKLNAPVGPLSSSLEPFLHLAGRTSHLASFPPTSVGAAARLLLWLLVIAPNLDLGEDQGSVVKFVLFLLFLLSWWSHPVSWSYILYMWSDYFQCNVLPWSSSLNS